MTELAAQPVDEVAKLCTAHADRFQAMSRHDESRPIAGSLFPFNAPLLRLEVPEPPAQVGNLQHFPPAMQFGLQREHGLPRAVS